MTSPAPPVGASGPVIAGVVLAAGSGKRFGGPKALADTGDGPWVLRALATLDSLDVRLVVVGASAAEVTSLLPAGVAVVDNPRHGSGMGSSLRAALHHLQTIAPIHIDAAVVMLVDLPDVPAAAVRRVVDTVLGGPGAERIGGVPASAMASAEPVAAPGSHSGLRASGGENDVIPAVRGALARATYDGTPGHPVLIGADHFAGVAVAASGDRGARDYLATHRVTAVECGDVASGVDIDRHEAT